MCCRNPTHRSDTFFLKSALKENERCECCLASFPNRRALSRDL